MTDNDSSGLQRRDFHERVDQADLSFSCFGKKVFYNALKTSASAWLSVCLTTPAEATARA